MTQKIVFNDKREFVKAILDESLETFVIYIAILELLLKSSKIMIHYFQTVQIAALE